MPESKNLWKRRFGKILRQVLVTYHLNADNFAKMNQIDPSTVRRWKEGKSCPIEGTEYYHSLFAFIDENVNDDLQSRKHMEDYIDKVFSDGRNPNALRYKENSPVIHDYLREILQYCIRKSRGRKDDEETQVKEMGDEKGSVLIKEDGTPEVMAVVFDFDGTLTSSSIRTTWESIWEKLGYSVKDCQELHKRFDRKEIDHPTWCKLTEEKFETKGMRKEILDEIADSITLLPGVRETFEYLRNKNIKIHIISGSILDVIKSVLGDLCQFVDGMKANQFNFDRDGKLMTIAGTEYDFRGKAKYISKIAKESAISTKNVLFVGNSNNDEFAHESGARTLCINPHKTSAHQGSMWHESIEECDDLQEILKYI